MLALGVFHLGIIYALTLRLTMKGTLGYRVLGIRYAYMFGPRPTMLHRVHRVFVGLYLIFLLAGRPFGFFAQYPIWLLFDERKQAWHDKIAGFYVVKRDARPRGTRRINRRVINFLTLSFVVWEPADDARSATA